MEFASFTLCLLAAAALFLRRNELRGTTLTSPLAWASASLLAVGGCELAFAVWDAAAAFTGHVRYMAAAFTLCPLMAVLGAKRPQDRGWQLIVVSLWMVLSLPAWQALLFWRDSPLHVHAVWRWLFLLPLLALALANNLPTRYWLSAMLVAAAQVFLLEPHLPELHAVVPFQMTAGANVLVASVLLIAACSLWALRIPPKTLPPPSLDRAFIEFRDLYGAVWALRVAARFNAAATMYGWGVWMSWSGLVRRPGHSGSPAANREPIERSIDRETAAAMRQNITQLLRRFVPQEWLADRLGFPTADSRTANVVEDH